MDPFIDLAMVTSAIVALGIEKIVDEAKHREAVIKILRKVGWADNTPSDFEGIYAYTLVEYGIGKPEFILKFFRDDNIIRAFRKSFEEREPSILNNETESFLEWSEIGLEFRKKDLDPRAEFKNFRAVFNEIINRSRTPKEIIGEHKIDDIHNAIFKLLSHQTTLDKQSIVEKKGYIDLSLYASEILERYQEWLNKYTSLLADEREIETYVIFTDPPIGKTNTGIPITSLPNQYHLSIVLGESGAGKTTALWKIMVESCSRLKSQFSNVIPILINMRDWNPKNTCRNLVVNQFIDIHEHIVEETLKSGNCVILIDSLNELPPNSDTQKMAKRDLINFLRTYQKNKFVLCCRTSDFDNLVDLDAIKEYFPDVKLFEIRRLTREQITEYIRKYFVDDPGSGYELIDKLGMSSNSIWNNSSSYVHLARIPLFLKLIIFEYKENERLPNNRSELIKSLVHNVFAREKQKSATRLDNVSKENLLGSLAYRSNLEGYYLKIPEVSALELIKLEVIRLKKAGMIEKPLKVGEVWREILSNNFLRITNYEWTEWLHQLIFDYFLAREIVRIWTRNNRAEIIQIIKNINNKQWQQPYEIAIGLLNPRQGAELLYKILQTDRKLAQIVFENQRQNDKDEIADEITKLVTNSSNVDSQQLIQLILSLPSQSIVEALGKNFKSGGEKIRPQIALAVSKLVISFLPVLGKQSEHKHTEGQYRRDFSEFEWPAVRRGLQLLRAWINNRNEKVKFYAAKGLWETDKGEAATALRSLLQSKNQKILGMVRDLMEKWGLT